MISGVIASVKKCRCHAHLHPREHRPGQQLRPEARHGVGRREELAGSCGAAEQPLGQRGGEHHDHGGLVQVARAEVLAAAVAEDERVLPDVVFDNFDINVKRSEALRISANQTFMYVSE